MSGPGIVRMRMSHIEDVLDIERGSFGMPWTPEGFIEVIENPAAISYVAEVDGGVGGYVCAMMAGGEAEVLKLAVRADLRGRGIGSSLNARCLDELRAAGCHKAFLEVRCSNVFAIRLYEGVGFKVAGVRKSYYRSPVEDALVMELSL